MEWIATIVVLAILFGPIIWAFTLGRRQREPEAEDPKGDTAYQELIRRDRTEWRA